MLEKRANKEREDEYSREETIVGIIALRGMKKWIVNDRKDLPWTEDKEVSEREQRGL